MDHGVNSTVDLGHHATTGEEAVLAVLWERYQGRLRQMIRLCLDRRLQSRVDPSDVLQQAYVDLTARMSDYTRDLTMPPYLWMRIVTGQRLMQIQRDQLGSAMGDADREISFCQGALPQASSASLAAQLLGRLTSASQAAARPERQLQLQQAVSVGQCFPPAVRPVSFRHLLEARVP